MNNFAGCIEGDQRHWNSETYVMSSDLKSRNSERFDARLHVAGINDEENAGQRRTRMSATLGDRGLALVAEQWAHNPCVVKGMHTRSQQIFLAGAGWAIQTDAHARGAAVTQRLRSAPFGGGET